VEVRHCLEIVVQRLAQLEQRLEWWQTQHDRRLEHAFNARHNKKTRHTSVRKGKTSTALPTVVKDTALEEPIASQLLSTATNEAHGPDPPLYNSQEHEARQKETHHNVTKFGDRHSCASCGTVESGSKTTKRLDAAGAYILNTEMGKYRDDKRGNVETAMSQVSSRSSTGMGGCRASLERLVRWSFFDHFFAFVIICNAIFIAVQTEYLVRTAGNPADTTADLAFSVIDKVFATMFAVELLLRMLGTKLAFFCKSGCAWNFFDMVLVVMSLIEVALEIKGFEDTGGAEDAGAGKVMRMFRMARVIRVMRVLRFLDELRTMVLLILHSMRSLFWLLVLLSIILFVFSIFFTQGIADYLATYQEDPIGEELRKFYGGLADSAFTLFMAITGGVSWIEVVRPLQETGWVFTGLFILYVSFCVFSVLNIVTGVFVDGAIQRSAQERDLRLEKEKEQKEVYINMLMDLLNEIDNEGTGVITRGALEEAFERERVKYTFSVLDIDIHDSNYLFDMLDLDRSGEVDMDEFVLGCLRLKGHAKSIDIHTLMFEIRHLIRKWDTLFPEDQPPPPIVSYAD